MERAETNRNDRGGKKTYRKPAVRAVPLRPEEAVLGFCKTASGFGPAGTCAVTCSTAGS